MEANRLKLNADKTELLWAGSRYGPVLLGSSGPSLDLGTEPIRASDYMRLLCVTISSEISKLGTYPRPRPLGGPISGLRARTAQDPRAHQI